MDPNTPPARRRSPAARVEASRYPGQEAQMMELFNKYPALIDNLRGPIFEEKVVDFVLGSERHGRRLRFFSSRRQ